MMSLNVGLPHVRKQILQRSAHAFNKNDKSPERFEKFCYVHGTTVAQKGALDNVLGKKKEWTEDVQGFITFANQQSFHLGSNGKLYFACVHSMIFSYFTSETLSLHFLCIQNLKNLQKMRLLTATFLKTEQRNFTSFLNFQLSGYCSSFSLY